LSVPEELAEKIKRAAGEKPVSAWVTDQLEADLNEAELERQWLEFYNDLNPTAADRVWVDSALSRLHNRKKSDPGDKLAT
jgi:hypothetical protein